MSRHGQAAGYGYGYVFVLRNVVVPQAPSPEVRLHSNLRNRAASELIVKFPAQAARVGYNTIQYNTKQK